MKNAGAAPALPLAIRQLSGGAVVSSQDLAILLGVKHIMPMPPPHAIIIGMPMFIIAIIRWQHSMNMSLLASSMGIISHFMPVDVIVQVILHIIIGIIPFIIMPFIMGIIPPIIGIMPLIRGIFIGIVVAAVVIGRLRWFFGAIRDHGFTWRRPAKQRKIYGSLHFDLIDWRLRS
jgi:hypothetical protein